MSIIGLLLLVFLLLSHPYVQSQLANNLTTKINKDYKTDIRVDGIAIGLTGRVSLKSFFIADHHADTLLYAKNFKTDLYSLSQWVDGNLFFKTAGLDQVFFKVINYEGEDQNSLAYFSDKLLSHVAPKERDPVFV